MFKFVKVNQRKKVAFRTEYRFWEETSDLLLVPKILGCSKEFVNTAINGSRARDHSSKTRSGTL